MESILKFLGFGSREDVAAAPGADTETVRRIVNELDHLDPERARFIAAFAYSLSRVANADMHISDDETEQMERVIVEQGHIPPAQAVIVVQMAKTQSLLFGGTENFLVVQEFNRIASRAEKLDLLRCLFSVSAADDTISAVEDGVVRQISRELLLEHADYIAVRAEFRDQLGVLKKQEDS